MPVRAPRACRRSDCGETTTSPSGYCDAHRRAEIRWKETTREPAHKRGYDQKWENVRDWFIAQNPLCENCRDNGIVEIATVVHHLIPIKQDAGERLSVSNLVSLCDDCHRAAHR